eukprot:scaffold1206_cov388-Prasinococcus_capsulatus_cf.AAC.27
MACLAAVSLSARSAQAGNCEHVFLRGCFPRRWSSSGQTPVCVAGHRERRPRRSRKPAAAAAGHSASTTRGHSPSQTVEDRRRSVVALGLRAVQNYEADFVMDTVAEEMLVEMLGSDTFCAQVLKESRYEEQGWTRVKFTGILFQPVPWSPGTKHGVPAKNEEMYLQKDKYITVNVPPNYMFKAKVFHPPRLCAMFEQADEQ